MGLAIMLVVPMGGLYIGHRRRQRNYFLDPSMPPKMFLIVLRKMYLRTAYSLALEKLGVVVPNEPKSTWMGCCDKAVIMGELSVTRV